MKQFYLLLAAAVCSFAAFSQNISYPKDPYLKTFITNNHQDPDPAQQAALRQTTAWQNFTASHGNWWVEFNEQTSLPRRAFGKPVPLVGATPEQEAMNFMENDLASFKLPMDQLVPGKTNKSTKYYYVKYKQQYKGVEVLWADATFRISMSNTMVMYGLDLYPNISLNTTPSISSDAIVNFAKADFDITVSSVDVEPALKILPLPTETGMQYKLVYVAHVHTVDNVNMPGNYYSLVDANTGEVYYRSNAVKECGGSPMDATTELSSNITQNYLIAPGIERMPYMRVTIGGTHYFADVSGNLDFAFITDPTSATIDLRGLWARVSEGTTDTNIPTVGVTLNPGDNSIQFDAVAGATQLQVSPYYWQSLEHDYMKTYWPDFTTLDVDQLIHVDRNDGTCNAYYDGTSTNFYAEGGGCPATSLFNDVVMHEYGHGINYTLYSFLGGAMNNGSMQEGYADVWALVNTENPIMAQGFFYTADSYVRIYDGSDPRIYPQDLDGEVHDNGEIIAGAWWDVGQNLGDVQAMSGLWNETHNATEDGPDGTEGTIYRNVLLDALVADDDDGDITDGTPHEAQISGAFCQHGISLIGAATLAYTEPTSPVTPDADITVDATISVDYPTYIGAVNLNYRTNSTDPYTALAMTNISGTSYEGHIPAQPAGTIVSYYFTVDDNGGCHGVTVPKEADLATEPNLPYFMLVGYTLNHLEDFDATFGDWEIDPFGTDDATTGQWDIFSPVSSLDGSYVVQTGTDHTPGSGNICAYTGNASSGDAPGTNDVDDGATTIRSPFFDCTGMTDPVFTYWRWYSNDCPTSANPANDVWQVRITNNGTDWVTVERLHTSDNSWRRNAIHIANYVTPTDKVGLLFIAQDSVIVGGYLDGGSVVEAAVDDMALYDIAAPDTTTDTTNSINSLSLVTGIYPNPASDAVNIYFGNASGKITMKLYNDVGELVMTKIFEIGSDNSYYLDCSSLAPGMYTLSVANQGTVSNKRLVITR